MIVVIFMPEGLVGLPDRIRRWTTGKKENDPAGEKNQGMLKLIS